MPIHQLKRIEDCMRDKIMYLDYLLYKGINFFKYKSFPKKINRILVIELLQLGDVLVATPILKVLKEKYKHAYIDILVNPQTKILLEKNKNIDQAIVYSSWSETKRILKEKKYDLGIILHPGSLKISSLLLLGGVKYRVGATKVGIFSGKGFFLNKKVKPNRKWQHKIQDNLDVLRSIDIKLKENQKIEITIDQEAKKIVTKFLKQWKGKKIIIHASSKHQSHKWMPERFARLADILVTKYKATILFTGTKSDVQEINYIMSNMRYKEHAHNIAGRTKIEQLIALTSEVDLVVTIDTSMTHIASATNTPIVVLFGPTVPVFWGPTGKKSGFIWKEKEACVGCRRSFCVYNKKYE